jgi:hypothetical protein
MNSRQTDIQERTPFDPYFERGKEHFAVPAVHFPDIPTADLEAGGYIAFVNCTCGRGPHAWRWNESVQEWQLRDVPKPRTVPVLCRTR